MNEDGNENGMGILSRIPVQPFTAAQQVKERGKSHAVEHLV